MSAEIADLELGFAATAIVDLASVVFLLGGCLLVVAPLVDLRFAAFALVVDAGDGEDELGGCCASASVGNAAISGGRGARNGDAGGGAKSASG